MSNILIKGNYTNDDLIDLINRENIRNTLAILECAESFELDRSTLNPLFMVVLEWSEGVPVFFNMMYETLLSFLVSNDPGFKNYPIVLFTPEQYFDTKNAWTRERFSDYFDNFVMPKVDYVIKVRVPDTFIKIPKNNILKVLKTSDCCTVFISNAHKELLNDHSNNRPLVTINPDTWNFIYTKISEMYGDLNATFWVDYGWRKSETFVPRWYASIDI